MVGDDMVDDDVLPVVVPGVAVAAPALGAGADAVEGARPPVDPPVPVPPPSRLRCHLPQCRRRLRCLLRCRRHPWSWSSVPVPRARARSHGRRLGENDGPPLVPSEPVAP